VYVSNVILKAWLGVNSTWMGKRVPNIIHDRLQMHMEIPQYSFCPRNGCEVLLSACLYVCLSARLSGKVHVKISPNFLYVLSVSVARLYGYTIMLCSSGFVDDVMFSFT